MRNKMNHPYILLSLCTIPYPSPVPEGYRFFQDYSNVRAVCISTGFKCGKEPTSDLFLDVNLSSIKLSSSKEEVFDTFLREKYEEKPNRISP